MKRIDKSSLMEIDKSLGKLFGKMGKEYEARTGYPRPLVDDILAYGDLQAGKRMLEVGCGLGQATRLFAETGLEVVGLDISEEFIELTGEKFSLYPNVSFRHGSFETIDLSGISFDAIASGMAWHWLDATVAYKKAHAALKEKGTLALFWSYQDREKSTFVQEVSKVLDTYGLKDAGPAGPRMKHMAFATFKPVEESGLFYPVEVREYTEHLSFTREHYRDLVLTYSWVEKLELEKRKRLVAELDELCGKYKEPLDVPYKYVLGLTKRKD